MSRVTNQDLQTKVAFLNKVMGKPSDPYAPGHLNIDHYNPGDNPYQYKLVEMMDNGGLHEWTSYRMTKSEFNQYLAGLIEGLAHTR